MSRWYRFAYRIGFTPWESDAPSMIPQFDQLLAVVEETRAVPLGSALDLGCGTGRWSVRLAERGWQVVGVDVVPRAIDAARNRSEQAGVDVTFKEGDVTALRAADVGSNFNLLLDMECLNWLSDSDRSPNGSGGRRSRRSRRNVAAPGLGACPPRTLASGSGSARPGVDVLWMADHR